MVDGRGIFFSGVAMIRWTVLNKALVSNPNETHWVTKRKRKKRESRKEVGWEEEGAQQQEEGAGGDGWK